MTRQLLHRRTELELELELELERIIRIESGRSQIVGEERPIRPIVTLSTPMVENTSVDDERKKMAMVWNV